jgi:hypothetical protein
MAQPMSFPRSFVLPFMSPDVNSRLTGPSFCSRLEASSLVNSAGVLLVP